MARPRKKIWTGGSSGLSAKDKFGCLAFVIVAGGICVMFAIKCCGGINWKFSEGSRSGVVQKLSKKGVFWKTWEGELNLGYNESRRDGNGNQTMVPAIFYFSVSDEVVAAKVKSAEKSGERVTLEYSQYVMRGYDKGGTSYDVTGVAELGSAEGTEQ